MTQPPMSCPVDGTILVMSERQGVEIDYCPSCRGVWLDRGELDKILERSAADLAPAAPPPANARGVGWHDSDRGRHERYGHDYPRRKRKKSFLEELFD